MSKRKKAVLAVGLVLAAFLIGAIIFYMHFIMNAGQTIETLQKLVAGNGYDITADCALTTFYLVDGKCYFGIDSIISAFASDEIDKSFLLKAAYNGWIKDHCVTLEQLTSLIYDLTGVTVENSLKMPGGMDAVLFLVHKRVQHKR